jgi:hypothetical protein
MDLLRASLGRSSGLLFLQILFVLAGKLPGVVFVVVQMKDFDFVALIQGRPELVFAEQCFRFHWLFACVAGCFYVWHAANLPPGRGQRKRNLRERL